MIAISRKPRLLVKLHGAPITSTFTFQASPISAKFDRLFQSIRPSAFGLGAAPPSEWYIVSAQQATAEVNAWDLCHHLVTEGFGITGLNNAIIAEPDFDQQWITGTPIEHALAVARDCEKVADPDSRLPPSSRAVLSGLRMQIIRSSKMPDRR